MNRLPSPISPLAPSFAVAVRTYGVEPRSERHDHLQVVLPLAGTLEMAIGGARGAVAGSRWAVVATGTDHQFAGRGENRLLVADFGRDLAGFAPVGHGEPFRDLDARAAALRSVLRAEAESGGLADPTVADALGRYALAALGLSEREAEATADDVGAGHAARTVARRVRGFLDAAWDEPVKLEDAAAAACCSPAHATRCFRALYGMGPIAYLQQVRIERARHLLETTDLSAGEVAARVGFVSQPWFTRLFAREVGLPPAAYRAASLRASGKGPSASGKR